VPEGKILGIKYGFRGFYDPEHKPIVLTKRSVDGIQLQGGTILGTSRGGANIKSVFSGADLPPAIACVLCPTDPLTAVVIRMASSDELRQRLPFVFPLSS
jgi:hypothetical protein